MRRMNTPTLTNPYNRHRFPAEIISHCVWLYFRFCLRYRDVEELMRERGVLLTYEAVRYWCRKFGQAYADQLRHRRPRPGDKWHLEMRQTQPINMSWCPLRLFEQMLSHPRAGFNRKHEMDGNRLSRDDDFPDQALRDGLPFFTREPVKILPQPLAKGCRMVDHLWPVDTLWLCVCSWLPFLLDLWLRGSELLTPGLELTQGDHLGLIGFEHAVVLPLEPLLPLPSRRWLRLQPGELLLLGGSPGLMPVRDHARRLQQLAQRLPNDGIESLRADELGRTPRRAADRQRRMPCALVVALVVLFAGTPLPHAHHTQPALATCDEGPQHITA
jgi:hypothetical protein